MQNKSSTNKNSSFIELDNKLPFSQEDRIWTKEETLLIFDFIIDGEKNLIELTKQIPDATKD